MRGLLNHAAVRRFIRDTSENLQRHAPITRIPPAEIEQLQAEFRRCLLLAIVRHPAHVKTFRAGDWRLRFGHG